MASVDDLVVLDRGDDTTVTVHLFGATLISWKIKGEEQIFVSSLSKYDNKKAIRGGIPIVFPQFGPWELGPQHGFARISRWTLSQAPTITSSNDVICTLTLEDTEETRKMWNHKFRLSYTITLKEDSVETGFKVENTGAEEFTFTCLLHTYFKVDDVTKVSISGLKGCDYTDKVKNAQGEDMRDEVLVLENVDSVYEATADEHVVSNTRGGRSIKISKVNLPDTVVWNPWKEKAAAMADFGDDEYPNMLCVEAGQVVRPCKLAGGATYQASQLLHRL